MSSSARAFCITGFVARAQDLQGGYTIEGQKGSMKNWGGLNEN